MRENRNSLTGAVIVFLSLLLLALPVSAASGGEGTCPLHPACGEENTICIYVFYGQGCPHCERAKPVIEAPPHNIRRCS
jgi:hypothetical protein